MSVQPGSVFFTDRSFMEAGQCVCGTFCIPVKFFLEREAVVDVSVAVAPRVPNCLKRGASVIPFSHLLTAKTIRSY